MNGLSATVWIATLASAASFLVVAAQSQLPSASVQHLLKPRDPNFVRNQASATLQHVAAPTLRRPAGGRALRTV